MAKTITDYTSQGLPSIVYFLAYIEPEGITVPGIAKKIFQNKLADWEKPYENKIYPIRDKLEKMEYFKKIGESKRGGVIWQSSPAPIVEKIKVLLQKIKDVELTELEAHEIFNFLDSKEFRNLLGSVKFDYKKEINSASEIIQHFDAIVVSSWLLRRKIPDIALKQAIRDANKKKIHRDYKKKYYEMKSKKTISKAIQKNLKSDVIFKNPETAEKFALAFSMDLLEKFKGLTPYSKTLVGLSEMSDDLRDIGFPGKLI